MALSWPRRRAPAVTLRRRRPGVRRLLSAGLVAAATAVGLQVLAPAPPRSVPVVVAARDLAAGQRIGLRDIAIARWAPGTGPRPAAVDVDAVLGRVTAGPIPQGAAVTDAGLLGPGLLAGQPPGLLAVPVRLADAAGTGLVRRGDRVDLLSAVSGDVVVGGVVVLTDPAASGAVDDSSATDGLGVSGGSGPGGGGVLVVAVSAGEAGRLALAQARGPLTLAVRPR